MRRTHYRLLCRLCMLGVFVACGRGEQRSTVPTGVELTGSGTQPAGTQPEPRREPPNSCDPAIALQRIDRNKLPDSIATVEFTGDSCPVAEGEWITRTIYPTPGREPRDRPIAKRLCQYLWKSPTGLSPKLDLLPPGAFIDPPVLALQAGDEEDYFKPLNELARLRWDIPSQLPEPEAHGRTIRVAVLDTAETVGESVIDANGHGLAVGKVVETLACAGRERCGVELVYYPALSFRTDAHVLRGPQRGAGAVGSRGGLAAEIRQATDDWLRIEPAKRTPLVINMSLGWSGCYSDPKGSELVRGAIAYATCQGALVLAAGGNGDVVPGCPTDPKPSPEDPDKLHMYPGLWGGAPLQDACKREQLPDPNGPIPLLVGIGAVDYRDLQLSFTDHESDLVAYGQAVSVHAGESPAWMAAGGTSLSTAAVSGMAALALRYKPDLPAFELFNKLYEGSVELRTKAPGDKAFICNRDLGTPCSDPHVNRLSACKLLNQVAGVPCTVLEAGKLTPVPSLKSRMPKPGDPISGAPRPCRGGDCFFDSATYANYDNRDKPWCDRQGSAPSGCTCSGPATQLVAGSLLAQANRTQVFLEVKFSIAVKKMKLVVKNNLGREQRFILGDAAADQLRRWRFDFPGAQTAKVEYELPDNSLEVSDVRLWYDWSPP
jgi:hypothetical protein